MTTKHEVLRLVAKHPDWTHEEMAAYLGCRREYVTATLTRAGIMTARAGSIIRLKTALQQVRSHLRSLPKSATAVAIDNLCADALAEPRTQP